MDIQFPLNQIGQNKDKTAEHWFDHYSVEIQKVGGDKIPLLNKDAVKKHEMVRFRGIISNQLNNEYFNKICQFRELDDLKQSDIDSMSDAQNNNDIMQRYPMILKAEPNQTEWCQSSIFGTNKNNQQTPVQTVMAKFYCHTKSLKICDSVEIYGIWSPKDDAPNEPEQSDQEEKKNPDDAPQDMQCTEIKKFDMLSSLAASPANGYDKLPTIHVLYWKKMECPNPLIPALPVPATTTDSSTTNSANDTSEDNDDDKSFSFYLKNASLIRASLIEYISKHYTSNDHLLAEYILLNMISRVVSNKNGILLGHFPLNIRGGFNNYKIRELYQLLLPYTLNINLTINYLNAKRFVPVKNNETDELEVGILQFRNNTAIVIDEVLLNPGNLNKTGLQNVEALQVLINEQKVLYDFQFHSIAFDVNSSIVLLSKGRPLPQLQTYCYLYCDGQKPEDEAKKEEQDEVEEEEDEDEEEEFTLDQYRIYLSFCGHFMDKFALNSKEVTEAIQDDFVKMRQDDKNANENTLHHRLLMMRLINSSFLNQTSDDDMMNILKYMQMLEMKRTARNKKLEPQNTKNTKGTPLNSIAEE